MCNLIFYLASHISNSFLRLSRAVTLARWWTHRDVTHWFELVGLALQALPCWFWTQKGGFFQTRHMRLGAGLTEELRTRPSTGWKLNQKHIHKGLKFQVDCLLSTHSALEALQPFCVQSVDQLRISCVSLTVYMEDSPCHVWSLIDSRHAPMKIWIYHLFNSKRDHHFQNNH